MCEGDKTPHALLRAGSYGMRSKHSTNPEDCLFVYGLQKTRVTSCLAQPTVPVTETIHDSGRSCNPGRRSRSKGLADGASEGRGGEEAAHIAENDILRPPQFRLMLLGQHSSYGIAMSAGEKEGAEGRCPSRNGEL